MHAFKVEKKSNGAKGSRFIRTGDKVAVRYTGTLENGKQFDSNQSKEGFVFTVGAGEVIKAWEEGILQMRKGMKARITAPPDYAYGESGHLGGIPANATLFFDIEVLDLLN